LFAMRGSARAYGLNTGFHPRMHVRLRLRLLARDSGFDPEQKFALR
jgi:hypothetical protein